MSIQRGRLRAGLKSIWLATPQLRSSLGFVGHRAVRCKSSSEEKLIATSELDSSFPGEYFCLADTHSFHHLILSVSRTHGHTSMLLGILFQYAFTTSVSGSVIYKSGHGPRRGRGLLSREPIRLLETLHYSLLVLHFEKSS